MIQEKEHQRIKKESLEIKKIKAQVQSLFQKVEQKLRKLTQKILGQENIGKLQRGNCQRNNTRKCLKTRKYKCSGCSDN